MPPILYLLDGHALVYRTYFALMRSGGDRFQTSEGEPTAGTYGFASVLLRILEKERPEYMAIAFDTGKTFRHDFYPEYKATRAKMPDDLRAQMSRIVEIVDTFGLPRLEMEGVEADDIIGSIAKQAVEKGFGVKVITGDRDLLQLVNDRIIVNLPGNKLADSTDYTAEKVKDYLGVLPEQVIDYKALAGDASDNIPGVPGIGDKTAVSLLQTYPTLEEIYTHINELPKRVQTRLKDGEESAKISHKLATIKTDVQITLELEKARTSHINFAAVEELFLKLEFRSLITRLHTISGTSGTEPSKQQLSLFGEEITQIGQIPAYQPTVHIVDHPESLKKLAETLENAAVIALDTETTSTDPLNARLVGISLSIVNGEGYYIPVGHTTEEPQLPIDSVLQALRPSLENPAIKKAGHNLKYDCIVLNRYGIQVTPLSFDTMIAGWLLQPESHKLGLKDMAENKLNLHMTHIEELIGKGKKQISMAEVPIQKAAPYAVSDADVSLQLMDKLQKEMAAENNATRIFTELEMPLVPVLMMMEQNGIALDIALFEKMASELNRRLKEIEIQIHSLAGKTFNINSTQQLSRLLFDDLKLEPPRYSKRTSSGHYSTSADILEALSGKHAVVDQILEYRELAKLKSTYVDALPKQINPQTGRVHTSFNQIGSVTGRLASSDPNLQNIPTRTEIGRKVREGFIAGEPDWILLAVDYSQIELRIVAHMSGDKTMLQAFHAGQDIHAATAAAIQKIPLEQVTKELRRQAKAVNFGLIYGMSAFGLSRSTDLKLFEAENFVQSYFEMFPSVKTYLDDLRQEAAQQGYVETMLGRKRYFPNLRGYTNPNLRNREEREAINAPIQGTAADIIKIAMIKLPEKLKQENLAARLLLQVHDELVLECPEQQLHQTVKIVQHVMENAFTLSVPLLTEARYGKNWGSLSVYQ